MLSSQIIDLFTRVVLLPPTNLMVLLLAGLLLQRRYPRVGRALSLGSAIVLFVVSSPAGSMLFVGPLEARTRPLTLVRTVGAQAIVVLGAGSVYRSPEYGNRDVPDEVALTRLRYAAHLQHATHLPVLVTGGNGTPDGRMQPKAFGMARALVEDFRTPVMWIEPNSETTEQNARFSAPILRAAGVRKILLVTHAMHMPRSSAAFKRVGIEVIEAPTAFSTRGEFSAMSWLPTASGLYQTYYAIHEWIGIWWYQLRAQSPAEATAPTSVLAPPPAAVPLPDNAVPAPAPVKPSNH